MKAASLLILLLALAAAVTAQVGGTKSLYGDITVEGSANQAKPLTLDLILYTDVRTIVARQTVSSNGRYRFNNLPTGFYDLVVELEGREVARLRIDLSSPLLSDRREDIAFAVKSDETPPPKGTIVSAADRYERSSSNAALLESAQSAIDKKHYDEGIALLQKLLANDPKDFPAWAELANAHLLQSKYGEAENEYLRAIDLHAGFFPALLNLGRLELAQQKYDVAVEVLTRAIKSRPESAEANRLLGESYLQIKKGSLAVGCLNEAIRLDPKGMAEVHLRLALLYHGAGMKDKAAAEYEAFLKKRPDYKDRKKLEDYIAANKKPQ